LGARYPGSPLRSDPGLYAFAPLGLFGVAGKAFLMCTVGCIDYDAGGLSDRPNGPGDLSPGLRPQADALGQQARPAPRPERPREPEPRGDRFSIPAEALAAFQAAGLIVFLPRASAWRPQPWAKFSRPVGPVERTREPAPSLISTVGLRLLRAHIPIVAVGAPWNFPNQYGGIATRWTLSRLHVRSLPLELP